MTPISAVTSSWTAYRLAVALAAALAIWISYTLPVQRLEGLLPDLAGRFMPEVAPSDEVVAVGIDAASLDPDGAWPWPRNRLAEVIEQLQRFHPRLIALRLPLHGTETPATVGALTAELRSLGPPLRNQARNWLQQLDTDARLAHTLKQAGNIVLFAPHNPRDNGTGPAADAPPSLVLATTQPDHTWYQAVVRFLVSAPATSNTGAEWPLPIFRDNALGTGVGAAYQPAQRVYGVPLVTKSSTGYLPGFELALLAAQRGHPAISVKPGAGISIGHDRSIATPDLRYYPRPARPVPFYTLRQIREDTGLGDQLRDKTVILGLTAKPASPLLHAPSGQRYNPLTWSAHVVDSLLVGNAYTMTTWFYGAQRGLILLFALYLLILPSTWHRLRAPIMSGLLVTLAFNAGLLTLILQQLWIPVTGPVVFLATTQLFLSVASRRQATLLALGQQLVEARVALGRQLQSQGQLELAMEQFAPCLPAPSAQESAYELGLEHERRRQANRAQAIFARLAGSAGGYRDAAQRSRRLADLSARFPGATDTPAANSTLVLDEPVMELPVLGRYRLERELGRGAMGSVYLASDPTIGRQVAIKTLPLREHYEAREQEAIARRFLQEAEAVGRLAHPNIVSIHDAGQEHDLAYMAMDYVEGDSLDAWTGESALLPVWEVLDIAAQVADALDYAHQRKVVHRDIKPANIIYDRDSGIVKITDFGIARILDNKRTRTGTVLGTPSYMSPEQVAGHKVNGQSDLFSLGATLFQLLTGHLPFHGDSVATLMYRIANQKTPSLRSYRRGLPVCVGRLLGRALQKVPARRFANGAGMAVALRKCRAQFKGGRRRTA